MENKKLSRADLSIKKFDEMLQRNGLPKSVPVNKTGQILILTNNNKIIDKLKNTKQNQK